MRVRGSVAPGPREVSDADFMARHPQAQAGVLVARQGTELDEGEDVQTLLAEALERVQRDPDGIPGHWIAYRLEAEHVDVVQLRPASAGERIEYGRSGDGWTVRDLWP